MFHSEMGDGRTAKPRGMYNRFRIAEDLALCEEVINANPFAATNKNASWNEIVDNLNAIPLFNKPTDERACKQRVEDLIMQFRMNDVAKLKRSRTEEQYEQLKGMLQEIANAKEMSEDSSESPASPSPRPILPKSSGKRSFPISMAEPESLPQRRQAFLAQELQQMNNNRDVKPIIPIAPKPTMVKVISREPRPTPPPVQAPVVKNRTSDLPAADYVTLLIQQNSRQMELRERELLQMREIREKELELERARIHLEDRKWEQHVEHLQQQLDLLREMLQQQQQQQQLLITFLRQQEDFKEGFKSRDEEHPPEDEEDRMVGL